MSIESSVVSAHTAYIAVDEDQDKPIEGAIQVWDLSATMVASEGGWGYGGSGSNIPHGGIKYKKAKSAVRSRGVVSKSLSPPTGKLRLIKGASPSPVIAGGPPPPSDGMLQLAKKKKVDTTRPKSSEGASSDKLTQLISLQQAEGFWNLDKVSSFMKKTVSSPISGVDPAVWATVIALVLLESCFSQQQDEWELVAMKAETWLSMQSLPAGFDVKKLKEEAKKLV